MIADRMTANSCSMSRTTESVAPAGDQGRNTVSHEAAVGVSQQEKIGFFFLFLSMMFSLLVLASFPHISRTPFSLLRVLSWGKRPTHRIYVTRKPMEQYSYSLIPPPPPSFRLPSILSPLSPLSLLSFLSPVPDLEGCIKNRTKIRSKSGILNLF